jgi:hypothetical protein
MFELLQRSSIICVGYGHTILKGITDIIDEFGGTILRKTISESYSACSLKIEVLAITRHARTLKYSVLVHCDSDYKE